MNTRIPQSFPRKKTHLALAALFAIGALAGCCRESLAQTAPAAPGATAGASPAAANPAALRPFNDVVKDAKQIPGYFTLWQKDDKVWLEVKPEQLGTPFFFQINSTRGLGEAGIHPNWMLRSHVAEFRKLGNTVQLVARNSRFTAKPDAAIARAVHESFADSLLATGTVASAAHPERKSFLVEANALFLADLPGMATTLETAFRLPYGYDARNSGFVNVRATDDMAAFNVSAHYAVPKMPAPPLVPSPVPMPPPPSTLEDGRSMLLGFYYTLAKLPETPMPARVADARVGHFMQQVWNYTDDLAPYPRGYIIKRWRLEKKDPAAALSEPRQPIVFWLDRNIPPKYRAKVMEGILEWNGAFEKIGFKNAIQVRQQQDDDAFDNNDTRHASVRWYVDTSDGALAIGPSRHDPRTGEILDADISFSDGWTRLPRRRAVEQLTSAAVERSHHHAASAEDISRQLARGDLSTMCSYAGEAMDEVAFALDLLAARGDIDPESPEAEKIVLDTLKDVVTHEVGHTLGLMHNFRASTIHTLEQMEDAAYTKKNGLSGSVMEYNALNISPKGKKQGEYVMSGIGPYDYWAIEYAYKPLDPATEKAELLKIAARSKEPQFAFANDLDAGLGPVEGMDPEVTRRDLGSDPLAFAERRIGLSRELWERLQEKKLKPGEQYDVLRRNFVSANSQVALAATVAAKYVGGVVHLRDQSDSGRIPLSPVPAAKQRKALKLITDELFRAESFRFKPEFVARLVPDQFERIYGNASLAAAVNPDVSISGTVLGLQRAALDQLMSDQVAARVLDAPSKMADAKQAMPLSEVYDTLQGAIWSELRTGGEISPLRRNLQRDHLRRVVNVLIKPAATTPADARSLQRANAVQLQQQIRAAMAKPASKETKAHLAESLDLLSEALKAPLQRTA